MRSNDPALLLPRLRVVLDAARLEYARTYPGRPVPGYISTYRDQLDCTTVAGACADRSLHSVRPARAADLDTATYSKTADPQGHAADFARIVQRLDPCIGWGGTYRTKDYPHFQLPFACDGLSVATAGTVVREAAGDAGAAVARFIPLALARQVDDVAADLGVTPPIVYLLGGAALAAVVALARS